MLLGQLATLSTAVTGIMSAFNASGKGTTLAGRYWSELNSLEVQVEALLKRAMADGCDETPYRALIATITADIAAINHYRG
ncbi:hypothetical protein, partial [Salmonella enterica]|uniref:hypothetical protein n=1 Tax=Salmonella enterica TaxID=28901 RepID=UPI003D2B2799